MQVIVLWTEGRLLVEKTKAMGCYGITSRKEKQTLDRRWRGW